MSRPSDIFLTPYYPQLKSQVRQSWKRLFADVPPPPEYTQAALWELHRDWVTIHHPQ